MGTQQNKEIAPFKTINSLIPNPTKMEKPHKEQRKANKTDFQEDLIKLVNCYYHSNSLSIKQIRKALKSERETLRNYPKVQEGFNIPKFNIPEPPSHLISKPKSEVEAAQNPTPKPQPKPRTKTKKPIMEQMRYEAREANKKLIEVIRKKREAKK